MRFQKFANQLLEALEGVLSGDLDLLFDRLMWAAWVFFLVTLVPNANALWVWWWEYRGKEAPFTLTKGGQKRLADRSGRRLVVTGAAFMLAVALLLA